MKSEPMMPTSGQVRSELKRVKFRVRYRNVLVSTVFALVSVAAVAVLVATLLLPVLQIYGTSMTPTLSAGEIVLSVKGNDFERGDILSFYYNNKILVKRVIAFAGEWVNIDDEGVVYVNDTPLEETYISQLALGDCDITLPYQVPDGKLFVMGDHRAASQDSRIVAIGCVAEEHIVGKIVFRIWPLSQFGAVE